MTKTKTLEPDTFDALVAEIGEAPAPSKGAEFVRALNRYITSLEVNGYDDSDTRNAKRDVDRLRAEITEEVAA